MRLLGVPECVVEGRLLQGGFPKNRGRPRGKGIDHVKWVLGIEAPDLLGVTYGKMLNLIDEGVIRMTIHMGRIYVSRVSIDEYKKGDKKLDFVPFVPGTASAVDISFIPLRELAGSSVASESSLQRLFIKLTEYDGRKYYDPVDAAIAFGKEVETIWNFVKKNGVEVVRIGDIFYLERGSFREALVKRGHIKPE